MVGRGSRLCDGKKDFLVLDMGGNAYRHGPLDMITGRVKLGSGPSPMKVCPDCQAVILAGLGECPDCGHQFEMERERALHDTKPADVPILSEGVSDWLPVTRVTYQRHSKPGSPDSMRVDYYAGLMRYSSWQCFQHQGYPAAKAASWWVRRTSVHVPSTVTEALDKVNELEPPIAIRVQRDGKWWRVAQERFG